MPSKLRKALGAVKDQTSISLAKVTSATNSSNTINLDLPILKATSHDEVPIDSRYLTEILQAIATDKAYAAACAQAIAKRVGKTRNWIVALKSLILVFRIFQHGDPHFPREVLHAMKNGAKILNLSNFRDDSNSSPWDYTAFVRTFALYLDERLDCFLSGKLHQRRYYSPESEDSSSSSHGNRRAKVEPVTDMKPATLIDRISYWQKLLDRAIATRPTGDARTNRLIQSSLLAIVQESFDLYRDISDGLALLLDSFFHLQYQSCVNVFQASVRASKQFEELSDFYGLCKNIGVGRTSEYPSVQKISDDLIETLQEFLKDQASFPGRSPTTQLLLPPPPASTSDQASSVEGVSGIGTESGSMCSSPDQDQDPTSSACTDSEEKQSETEEDCIDADDDDDDDDQEETNAGLNFMQFGLWPSSEKQDKESAVEENSRDCWELVLLNTANEPAQTTFNIESNGLESLMDKRQYNPFLQETTDSVSVVLRTDSFVPHFQNPKQTTTMFFASIDNNNNNNNNNNNQVENKSTMRPTFCAQNPKETKRLSCDADDPFESNEVIIRSIDGSVNEQSFIREQQLWLEHQKKIIAKNMT